MKKVSILAVAFLCLIASQSISANDECSTAIAIPVGTCFEGNTLGATFSSTAPVPTCSSFSGSPLDVWFSTVVPATGNIRVQATESTVFGLAEIYSGSCGSLANLTSSLGLDCGIYPLSNDPIVIAGLTPGTTLFIRVSDLFDNLGDLTLCVDDPSGCTDRCSISFDPNAAVDDGSCLGPVVSADLCANAIALPGPGSYAYNSNGATGAAIASCDFFGLPADIWYSYPVGTGLDSLLVSQCRSNFAPAFSLWDACGGTELACETFSSIVFGVERCGEDVPTENFTVLTGAALDAIEGTTILVRISGNASSTGCGDILIEEIADPSACNASVAPTGLTATIAGGSLEFNWDAFTGAVGCQIQAGPAGGGFPIKRNFVGAGLTTSGPIPTSIIDPGSYQAQLVCACSISPLSVSPASNLVFFTVTEPRFAAAASFGEVSLMPNPANDRLRVTVDSWSAGELQMRVYSLLGSEIISATKQLESGPNSFQLDLSSFESGSYLIKMTNGKSTSTAQFEVIK